MAQLTFNKVTVEGDGASYYECVQTVNNDFNLHVERSQPSVLSIGVKTAGTKYATAYHNHEQAVFDVDFDDLVYPKTLRIRSWSLPTYAAITEKED